VLLKLLEAHRRTMENVNRQQRVSGGNSSFVKIFCNLLFSLAA